MKIARLLTLAFCLAALLTSAAPVDAAAGDLDLSFAGFAGDGIVVKTGVPMPHPWMRTQERRGMALQRDGKIVTAGYTGLGLLVMRFLPDGSPDATFSDDGVATHLHSQVVVRGTSVAIQADGKIVVAGWADSNPANFMVARLTLAGGLDASFGNGGFVITDFDDDTDQAWSVLVQPDGKIVACGRADISGDSDFAVARYHPNGALDTSFAGDGKGSVGFGADEECNDIALQADGKLVLVGGEYEPDVDGDFEVARLNSDGSPDILFGEIHTGFGSISDLARAVAIQPDGKIVVAGDDNGLGLGCVDCSSHVLMARYHPNGDLDASFNGSGKREIDSLSGEIYDLALQPDGKLLLTGFHYSPDEDIKIALYRLNADGALDATFDGGSKFINVGAIDVGYALALQPDGRILVYASTGSDHVLLRLWQDATFDAGGKQVMGVDEAGYRPGSDETASAIAVQPDNKIILAGEVVNAAGTASDAFLARFHPGGMPDTSFGVQGVVTFGFGAFNGARALAIQPDNKIVAAGYFRSGSTINLMVARFNPDGSPDNTFALIGSNLIDFAGGDDYGNALALAPDGKIVVAGTVFNGTRNVFGVARFNGNGTPDNTFDGDAKQLIEFAPGPVHSATSVVVQPDRKIVAGGTFNANFALVRLNENGSVDGTFGLSGLMQTDMGGNDTLNALTITSNGWFYAAGVRDAAGAYDFALAQYKPNGTLAGCPPFPCSVWSTGKAYVNWGGTDTAFAVDWRADGNVLAAGCSDGQFAWAQLRTNTTIGPLTGRADFAGDECALGAKYYGSNRLLLGGRQTFNGDTNAALARFETTPIPNVVKYLFLPLLMR